MALKKTVVPCVIFDNTGSGFVYIHDKLMRTVDSNYQYRRASDRPNSMMTYFMRGSIA